MKYIIWMFEIKFIDILGDYFFVIEENVEKIFELVRGDVRIVRWMFEINSLDLMNKMY